ncbi:MAG TPA: hypothetical protein VF501_09505, partial [Thiobacillus sp.]
MAQRRRPPSVRCWNSTSSLSSIGRTPRGACARSVFTNCNEQERAEQLLRIIEKIRKLDKETEHLEETLERKKLTEV